jgi:hypothetical protein
MKPRYYGMNTTRRASSAGVHALWISASGTARVATRRPAGFAAANTAPIAATNLGPGTLTSPLPMISIGVERSTSARSETCPPVTAPTPRSEHRLPADRNFRARLVKGRDVGIMRASGGYALDRACRKRLASLAARTAFSSEIALTIDVL